jgi:hypothetical protein
MRVTPARRAATTRGAQRSGREALRK